MTDRTGRPPSAFRLNLEQQKNRAKDLLRAAKASDAEALARLGKTGPEAVKLADAQFAIARELRFASWTKLKAHIASMERHRAAIDKQSPALDGELHTLHIRCGHDIQKPLEEAGFVGDFLVHAFPYISAPLRSGAEGREWMARHLVDRNLPPDAQYEQQLEGLRHHEERLHASAQDCERAVIWMEHDSWDQLILARLLAHYANAKRPRVLELITLDEFPGSQRFLGLGQLPPEALRLLWSTRKPVTPEQLALGNAAWEALTADDPRDLAALVRSGTPALPIMGPALHRHLRELPSVENGLRLSEQLVLERLSEHGPLRLQRVWSALTLELDPLPYNTDLLFVDLIEYLLAAREPVLTLVPGLTGKPFGQLAAITEPGRAVLCGERDWLSLRPPSRWVGGVHIQPGGPAWRWDEIRREAVRR